MAELTKRQRSALESVRRGGLRNSGGRWVGIDGARVSATTVEWMRSRHYVWFRNDDNIGGVTVRGRWALGYDVADVSHG